MCARACVRASHMLVFDSKWVFFARHGTNGDLTFLLDFKLKLWLSMSGMCVEFIDSSWSSIHKKQAKHTLK